MQAGEFIEEGVLLLRRYEVSKCNKTNWTSPGAWYTAFGKTLVRQLERFGSPLNVHQDTTAYFTLYQAGVRSDLRAEHPVVICRQRVERVERESFHKVLLRRIVRVRHGLGQYSITLKCEIGVRRYDEHPLLAVVLGRGLLCGSGSGFLCHASHHMYCCGELESFHSARSVERSRL